MARVRPLIEREAIWALALAGLGAASMWTTLPAAVWLATRTLRRRTGGDGSEPAIAVLAFGVAWLNFLLAYPAIRAVADTTASSPDAGRGEGFFVGLVAVAVIIAALSAYAIRVHPERWVARAAATSGVVAAVCAALFQVAASFAHWGSGGVAVCGSPFSTSADCVTRIPWAVVIPAIGVGGLWFLLTVAVKEIARTTR